jgi:hypothetical protein
MAVSNRQFLIGLVMIIQSGTVFADEITRDGALELTEECQKQPRSWASSIGCWPRT